MFPYTPVEEEKQTGGQVRYGVASGQRWDEGWYLDNPTRIWSDVPQQT